MAAAITANSSIRLAVLASEDKLWVLDYASEAAPGVHCAAAAALAVPALAMGQA